MTKAACRHTTTAALLASLLTLGIAVTPALAVRSRGALLERLQVVHAAHRGRQQVVAQVNVQIINGHMPIVAGETNLPNGFLLSVSMKRPGGQYLAGPHGAGYVTVRDGRFIAGPFSDNTSNGPIPPGTYEVEIVSVSSTLQPPKIQRLVGKTGTGIRGPLAGKDHAGGRGIEYRKLVEVL